MTAIDHPSAPSTGPIRLAVVGCGGIAEAHARAAKRVRDVRLVAAVDPLKPARDRFASEHDVAAFESVAALLTARDAGDLAVDAALICTPPSARQEAVLDLLDAELDLLVEKPLAHRLPAAQRLVAFARERAERVTAVAFCHRFTPAMVRMRELLHAGRIGVPQRFENVFACWFPGLRDKWMSDPAVSGGGSLVDTACHALDLFGWMLRTPGLPGTATIRLHGCTLQSRWAGRGETGATLLASTPFQAPPGDAGAGPEVDVAATICSGWAEADRFTVRLVGDAGTLSYDFVNDSDTLHFRGVEGTEERLPVRDSMERFPDQLAAFAAAVRRDADAGPGPATFDDGLAVARLIDQAYAAAGRRGTAAPRVRTPQPARPTRTALV